VGADEVAELAAVAGMEGDELVRLSGAWGGTSEFEGWSGSDVSELLRAIGDLAESAALECKCLLLWQCL
jgi:hypothetical protein